MTPAIENTDFIVKRDDWRQCRFVPARIEADLEPGQVLFRVDRFAFTSNNVSYALAGDMLDYWGFFPTEEGWGRIPAMGFGNVVGSRHPDVPEGERVFGFFPMSTGLVIEADGVTPAQFADAAPHRRNHAPFYRQYTRVTEDPFYDAAHEDSQILLQALFMTSFLVDDFVADNDLFGARSFVISSASSKTAIALAFLLARGGRGRVIGLTSPRNIPFVEGLGYYDQALPYDELKSLPKDVPVVFVDHSGDGDVVNGLHHHFGNNLKYSCIVGGTHWDAGPRADDLPGAPPTFFFAPAQAQKRMTEWGPAGFQERLGNSWQLYRAASEAWLRVVRGYGKAEVERVYREVLEGRAAPSEGHVLSLHEGPEES
jgi:hypothetical protein